MDKNLEIVKISYDRQVNECRQELIREMRSLGQRMIKSAEWLEKDPRDYNQSGEVQGMGVHIDKLCAKYSLLQKIQENLNNIK